MQAIRSALLGLVAFVAAAVPAGAQTAVAAAPVDNGPSLLWVWVWILVAGVIVMIVGTSAGVNSNKR